MWGLPECGEGTLPGSGASTKSGGAYEQPGKKIQKDSKIRGVRSGGVCGLAGVWAVWAATVVPAGGVGSTGGTGRFVSGSVAGACFDGVDVPGADSGGGFVVEPAPVSEWRAVGAGDCRGPAAVGLQCAGAAAVSERAGHDGRGYGVDAAIGECGAGGPCGGDGRGAADAAAGAGQRVSAEFARGASGGGSLRADSDSAGAGRVLLRAGV